MSWSVPPFLLTMLPRNVNPSTSSICAPTTDTPSSRLVPIRINFKLSWGIDLQAYLRTFKARVLSIISCILCDSRARSSAKSTSVKYVVKVHWIPLFLSKAVLVTQSRPTSNSGGGRRQPCFTHILIFNGWVLCPLRTTCAETPHPQVAKMRGDRCRIRRMRVDESLYPERKSCGFKNIRIRVDGVLVFYRLKNILVNILRLLPTTILFSNVFGVWMALR